MQAVVVKLGSEPMGSAPMPGPPPHPSREHFNLSLGPGCTQYKPLKYIGFFVLVCFCFGLFCFVCFVSAAFYLSPTSPSPFPWACLFKWLPGVLVSSLQVSLQVPRANQPLWS